jgi:uncharacterized protein with PQ loop repeat
MQYSRHITVIPRARRPCPYGFFCVWVIGIWRLEFIWDLVLGIWNLSCGRDAPFGAKPAPTFGKGCVPLLSLVAYLPQWKQIIANRSSKDIPLTSWLVWMLSSSIAIFYAVIQYQVTGKGTALIFSSVLVLVFEFITPGKLQLSGKSNNEKPDPNSRDPFPDVLSVQYGSAK